MKRLALFGVLVAAASFALAPDAFAHGGQFKAPGGAVDPGQRAPEDPTPPPPPPPSGPPTTPSPTDPGKPGPTGPTTPPPSAPPPPTTAPGELGGTQRGKAAGLSYDQWVFWYAYNNAELENLKDALYSKISSDNPLAVMGSSGSNQGSETHDVRTKITSDLIPAMLWARDPKNARHNDVESAAYIGLAKMTKDPTHIDLIREGLDKKFDQLIKESAALALGLLRRAKPEDQFAGSDLDRVRSTLFDVLEDDDYETRVRCFAAFAIGMLGDQASGSGSNSKAGEHTARLFSLLERDWNDEITTAIMTAIGLQDPSSVTEPQRNVLRDCVTKGKLGRGDAKGIVPSEAAATLGRVGTDKDVDLLLRAIGSRRTDRFTESSIAIALGKLAPLIASEQRTDLAKGIIGYLKKSKNQQATNFALISLAYIAMEDVKAGKTDAFTSAKVGEYLMSSATSGRPLEKPYGALALALVAREIGDMPTVEVFGEFRHKAITTLREGVSSGKLTARDQAAFAIGLGIAKDEGSVGLLMDVVKDRKENWEKQGYAAVAIGMATPGTNVAASQLIRETLVKTNEEELKIRCATALGLLKDRGALEMLLKELKDADTQSLKGQIALAIAKIGDGRSIPPMVEIMKDTKEKDLTRAIVTAALGVIGDMELIPSLNRVSKDINYRAMNDSRNEVVSIL